MGRWNRGQKAQGRGGKKWQRESQEQETRERSCTSCLSRPSFQDRGNGNRDCIHSSFHTSADPLPPPFLPPSLSYPHPSFLLPLSVLPPWSTMLNCGPATDTDLTKKKKKAVCCFLGAFSHYGQTGPITRHRLLEKGGENKLHECGRTLFNTFILFLRNFASSLPSLCLPSLPPTLPQSFISMSRTHTTLLENMGVWVLPWCSSN